MLRALRRVQVCMDYSPLGRGKGWVPCYRFTHPLYPLPRGDFLSSTRIVFDWGEIGDTKHLLMPHVL